MPETLVSSAAPLLLDFDSPDRAIASANAFVHPRDEHEAASVPRWLPSMIAFGGAAAVLGNAPLGAILGIGGVLCIVLD